MAPRWYVIKTRPRSERIAVDALRREGYEYYFPRVELPHKRTGMGTAPPFPRYLFLRWDLDLVHWPPILLMPGILGWVRFDGRIPHVPDEVVGDLARRVRSIKSQGGLWTRFKRGQAVRVTSGMIESLASVVTEPTSPKSRVRVLMEFMGQLVSAEVPLSDLRPVPEDPASDEEPRSLRRTRGRGRWIRGMGPRSASPV